MSNFVTTFQLGTSTVVTLPKKLGIKPGQRLEVKSIQNGNILKLEKKESLWEVLERSNRNISWTDQDFKDYQKRRKLGIEAIKKMKKIW